MGTSLGAHALTRTLPAALIHWWKTDTGIAAELAALTHAGAAITTAALGADLLAALSRGEDLDAAASHAQRTLASRDLPPLDLDLPHLVALGSTSPGDVGILRTLAKDATAPSALAGGVYAAVNVERRHVRDALLLAASAADGGHAATVTGALLGTIHGPDALPIDWVARLELTWPGDTLARDLVQQVTEHPSGGEYTPATDPDWLTRYPGA
ncbi:ADP-ribosylglycohydrolase family protein [Asanoa sp. NPDC049518]|uniref:ADP-ribosylglycohydrolase family protein n=1 Tax=unclassified Asanoa TaxID=2685164 RepID=UPI003449A05E